MVLITLILYMFYSHYLYACALYLVVFVDILCEIGTKDILKFRYNQVQEYSLKDGEKSFNQELMYNA